MVDARFGVVGHRDGLVEQRIVPAGDRLRGRGERDADRVVTVAHHGDVDRQVAQTREDGVCDVRTAGAQRLDAATRRCGQRIQLSTRSRSLQTDQGHTCGIERCDGRCPVVDVGLTGAREMERCVGRHHEHLGHQRIGGEAARPVVEAADESGHDRVVLGLRPVRSSAGAECRDAVEPVGLDRAHGAQQPVHPVTGAAMRRHRVVTEAGNGELRTG